MFTNLGTPKVERILPCVEFSPVSSWAMEQKMFLFFYSYTMMARIRESIIRNHESHESYLFV